MGSSKRFDSLTMPPPRPVFHPHNHPAVPTKIRAGEFDGIDHWEYLINSELAAANGSPRQEMMYNFDPYILWSSSGDT